MDNLKVCLTGLVIFHHAGQAYGWAFYQEETHRSFEDTIPIIFLILGNSVRR